MNIQPAVAKAPNQVRDASTMAGKASNQPSLKLRRALRRTSNIERRIGIGHRQTA